METINVRRTSNVCVCVLIIPISQEINFMLSIYTKVKIIKGYQVYMLTTIHYIIQYDLECKMNWIIIKDIIYVRCHGESNKHLHVHE